ncbi:MAG TPA: hypothetical protein DIW47_05585 [Bacteroidetes bacterium]|nr:hypothetical protein [Bacteroidota bacterium]
MTPENSILWKKIRQFELDDESSSYTFSDRLAKENAWEHHFALRCLEEYKRFIYLMMIASHPLTPSDPVDQVWHLHLLYTHSYWDDFCEKTLGRKIHHGPTKGGDSEKEKFNDWYEKTLLLYRLEFGNDAPVDIWPDSTSRFEEINFTRVNRHRYWLLPKLKKWKWNS